MEKHTFFMIMALVLFVALDQIQAKPKKGCEAFGHACYGGHGKRSVISTPSGIEDYQMHPDMIPSYSSEGRSLEQYRRARMINFLKQLIEGRQRYGSGVPSDQKLYNYNNENDYPLSAEFPYKENPGLTLN